MQKNYEDEIGLIDLFKTLFKHKKLILLTIVIINIISVSITFYVEKNKQVKFQQDFTSINFSDSYYIKKANLELKKFTIENILLNDKIVNEFYKDEEFNKYFQNKNIIPTIYNKRKFLNNSLKLTKSMNGQKIKNYSLISYIKDNKELSKKLITIYISIIDKEKKSILINAANTKRDFVIKKRNFYEKKVKVAEKKIIDIIKLQPQSILKNQSLISIISLTNPRLLQETNSDRALYEKYYNQAIGINGILNNNNYRQIDTLSSIYEVEKKSKSLMLVTIGFILSIFSGIFIAFLLI